MVDRGTISPDGRTGQRIRSEKVHIWKQVHVWKGARLETGARLELRVESLISLTLTK
jgi:hypothetical protein